MPPGRHSRLIDVTRPLDAATFVFPGDPPILIESALDPARGDPARVTRLSLGTHAGTHIDAPSHLPGLMGGVESWAPEALVGPALVVRVRGPVFGPRQAAALPRRMPPRLLLAGGPTLTPEAARMLVGRRVRLVGTDGNSIDPQDDDAMPAHRALLEAGVVVLECLDLSAAPSGPCGLMALPLRIPGADGAPARVILRVRSGGAPAPRPSPASKRRSRPAVGRRRRPASAPPAR